jgi:hypothetical protein
LILQSSHVIKLVDAYLKQVPEVPIRLSEGNNRILLEVPSDFNTKDNLTRQVATAEILKLQKAFMDLGATVTIGVWHV